ncbi:carbohydrate ABC transporter permease [Lentzea pudingi]|uniref:carbohydrate ABC transporter permease n=1 Tax=Lentzea pudingi TaxID=1789439 RepID=UPI001E5A1436|nr:sugar ABC transporter permease [Lentzea pudingi]
MTTLQDNSAQVVRGPATTAPPPPLRRKGPASRRNDTWVAWLLVTPAVLGFGVFFAYPMLRGVYLSFTDFHILSPPVWTGLENIRELLNDNRFWHSLGVTAYFVVLTVVLGIGVSLLTAVVLHRLGVGTTVRGLMILPFLISGVVTALVWTWMLDPQLGIVNQLITWVTGEPVMFFSSDAWAVPTLAALNVWKSMGYNAVLIFAGLQTIPATIYEAGRIDGASEFQMFRSLTLPLLRPILVMVVILNVINATQIFDIVQVSTKGGPADASLVLQMYIYDKAFGQFDFGYAATMSLALFLMLVAVTFTQMRMARAGESDTD